MAAEKIIGMIWETTNSSWPYAEAANQSIPNKEGIASPERARLPRQG